MSVDHFTTVNHSVSLPNTANSLKMIVKLGYFWNNEEIQMRKNDKVSCFNGRKIDDAFPSFALRTVRAFEMN